MMDKLTQTLNEIVDLIESRHYNDPIVAELLEKMAKILMEDELVTINFLKSQSIYHEHIIRWVNTYFDDIACEFHSNQMADAMISLVTRYPNDNVLKYNVDLAVKIINNIKET
jgi:hypothetical protein